MFAGKYPNGVEAVPRELRRTGFFAGNSGVRLRSELDPHLPDMPNGRKYMIVGQDWYSRAGYDLQAQKTSWHEDDDQTWRNLKPLLMQSGISLDDCFFTNFYMGLRSGDAKVIGPFPGSRCQTFVGLCRTFFMYQIETMQPRVVIALGKEVFRPLGEVCDDLNVWRKAHAFSLLDEIGPIKDAKLVRVPHPVTFVGCVHPCLRNPNVHRRKFGGLNGHSAEVAMLVEAKRRCDASKD